MRAPIMMIAIKNANNICGPVPFLLWSNRLYAVLTTCFTRAFNLIDVLLTQI